LRIIFGIGNYGSPFSGNRHNAGFLFLDFFANKKSLGFLPSKGDYYKAGGVFNNFPYLLIKPTTFVNNSGLAASQLINTYDIKIEDLLVLCDDTNLDIGTFRLRLSGGDGGHNGLASIIYNLNSNKFPRIRIGVGKDVCKGNLAEFVLSDFEEDEIRRLTEVFEKTAVLVEEFIIGGSKAMLDLNSKLYFKKNK
jgi:PTH1 family peptidyl-tRNA hydrolase